jgi:hypothetical protein
LTDALLALVARRVRYVVHDLCGEQGFEQSDRQASRNREE